VTGGLEHPVPQIELAGPEQLVVAFSEDCLRHLAEILFDCLHHKSNHTLGFG